MDAIYVCFNLRCGGCAVAEGMANWETIPTEPDAVPPGGLGCSKLYENTTSDLSLRVLIFCSRGDHVSLTERGRKIKDRTSAGCIKMLRTVHGEGDAYLIFRSIRI